MLVYGEASWGWSRMGLGLVYGGFKNGFSRGCVKWGFNTTMPTPILNPP